MNISDFISHENIDDKIDAEQVIGRLTHIERAVLYLFVEGYSQVEIGNIFGYSPARICQILKSIEDC